MIFSSFIVKGHVKGVSDHTAHTLLFGLPEPGNLNRQQIAFGWHRAI
jgi:hypothetical protein